MPRRALRTIDSDFDLSSHLFTLDELPRPFQGESFFARPAPLEIEVGSGKGLFMQRAATLLPERNFLGCEIAQKYAHYSAVRLIRHEVTNAVMVNGDANKLFEEYLPDGCAAAVHVYFPDPWWKNKHRKRRVMNERFAAQIVRVLEDGGRLHFWTDVEEYFQRAVAMLRRATPLEGPLPVPEAQPEHDLDYRTHFERRMRRHGEPIYRSEWVRPPRTQQPLASE